MVRKSLADCFLVLIFLLDFSLFSFGVFSVSVCLEKEENRPGWPEVSVVISSDMLGVLNTLW